jgi:BirA family biotin operon repressor/biotin-[acetyl-CoA-carboxylase] ligase
VKGKILDTLRKDGGVVSGEALSAMLGVSRVTIWKHIQKLQEAGYPIESTPKGYRLGGSPDLLYPWEFPGREDRIHFFPELPSTMNVAREMARNGAPHFTVVIAECQVQGRGRLDRQWYSDAGGLYFTVVLRPKMAAAYGSRINFAASLALAETLSDCCGIDARVKWPNDVLVDGRKISGMLSEMEAEADLVSFANVGIGINVNNDPTMLEPRATSVKRLIGRTFSRRDLLADFLDRFQNRMDHQGLETVIDQWKAKTITLDRPVRVVTANDTVEGHAVDVDHSGALILRRYDGALQSVIYGDCFL